MLVPADRLIYANEKVAAYAKSASADGQLPASFEPRRILAFSVREKELPLPLD
jgi:hypothetical protein